MKQDEKKEEKVYNLPLKKEELFIVCAALGTIAKTLKAEAASTSDIIEALATAIVYSKVADFIERNVKSDNGD